jgi:hypothetical protein
VTTREDLAHRCETIEQAYEFMLAYATQGLSGDAGSQTGGQLRELLSRAAALLTDILLIDEVLKSQTTESPQTSKP